MSDGPAQTSIYLTDTDREMVRDLMETTGLNRTGVIRLALKRMHRGGEEGEKQGRLLEIADEIRELA